MGAIRVPFVLDALLISNLCMSDKRLGGDEPVVACLKSDFFFGGLYMYYRNASNPLRKFSRSLVDNETWIMVNDPEWEFSFINLCSELGIEPESLRLALVRWKNSSI